MTLLHYRADWRSIAGALLTLGLLMIQWLDLVRHPLLWLVSCGCVFFCTIANHNHQHHVTFRFESLNRLWGAVLTWCIGFPARSIVPMHNHNHHAHNNQPEDHVRASIVTFRWNLANLLLFPVFAIRSYLPVKLRTLRKWRESSPEDYRQLRLERWAFYPVAIALLLWNPLATLIYLALPYAFGQWAILAINLVQHDGCDPESRYNHSRNFIGRSLNWILLNNGFHTAHHLAPGMHWSELPRLHRRIETHIDRRLNCRSLLETALQFYLWPGRRPQLSGGAS